MMIACCIPMLVIAIVLVAAGAVSVSWLFAALMCTAMMALMDARHAQQMMLADWHAPAANQAPRPRRPVPNAPGRPRPMATP
jgi:hypothetical protein